MMILPRSDSISRGQLVSISCVPCALMVVAVNSAAIATSKVHIKISRIRIDNAPSVRKMQRSLTLWAGLLHLLRLGVRWQVRRRVLEKAKGQTMCLPFKRARTQKQNLIG